MGGVARASDGVRVIGRKARRSSIAFIMADDPGSADLFCFGARDYRAPHCDALAASG
ncbi:hypothetical protein [Croceicoccus sp. YJ47]|uniref:hypothetical protein n=1 Tax=Croceicoccus sp. YJ47 TaxID=2798724 RepID=UPI0019222BE4|nr:hypothetical protein [Croceicoccus sp. YJ47]QQN74961.1 hypothetical protein JD971_04460 [Croceicoccus sp. YJ47]